MKDIKMAMNTGKLSVNSMMCSGRKPLIKGILLLRPGYLNFQCYGQVSTQEPHWWACTKRLVSSGDEYNFLIFQSGYLQNPSTRKQPNVNNKMKYFIESGIFQLNTKTRKASIACAVDFTSYPFDDHRCEFAMRSSMNLSYHVFN